MYKLQLMIAFKYIYNLLLLSLDLLNWGYRYVNNEKKNE